MRVAFDTNILAYSAGVLKSADDERKAAQCYTIILALGGVHQMVVPTQALGELFNVLRRYHSNDDQAAGITNAIAEKYELVAAGPSTFRTAFQLAAQHSLQTWDSLILMTASEAGCELLLSEDMQSGFVWGGVTVVNPFAGSVHPALAQLLND